MTNLPFPYTKEVGRAWIAATRERDAEARHWNFAVTDAASARLAGSITLRDVDLNGQIGYWVARAARGRGVATRALILVSRWALDELGYPRVQLLTHPENRASQRVAEKAGFTCEAVLPSYIDIRGGRYDGIMFGRLPGELREG